MKLLPSVRLVFGQLVRKPATNLFPAKYLPRSVTRYLAKVQQGKALLTPPVATPVRFRGKIVYDRETCIGCKICTRICPANAIEFLPETKKVRIYVTQCVFCSQCNDACPVSALHMSNEFLLATADRYSDAMIVE